jgi:fructose-specific phosphotransferase system IIC component
MRASYDRAWQKKTRDKSIYRITPDINNVSYIGINYASSFFLLAKKISTYSKPAIYLKDYQVPKFYIIYAIFSVLLILLSFWAGILNIVIYFILRGYLVPVIKSHEYRKLFASVKSILLLPVVGAVIDLSRLYGYVVGYGLRFVNFIK